MKAFKWNHHETESGARQFLHNLFFCQPTFFLQNVNSFHVRCHVTCLSIWSSIFLCRFLLPSKHKYALLDQVCLEDTLFLHILLLWGHWLIGLKIRVIFMASLSLWGSLRRGHKGCWSRSVFFFVGKNLNKATKDLPIYMYSIRKMTSSSYSHESIFEA